jgi:hypothetical protein
MRRGRAEGLTAGTRELKEFDLENEGIYVSQDKDGHESLL